MIGGKTSSLEKRKKADKKTLSIFKILIIVVLAFSLFNLFIRGRVGISTFINVLFNGLTVSFFFTGLISWYHYGKNHILGYRKFFVYILITFAILSALFITALFIHYRGLDLPIFEMRIALQIWTLILGFFTSFLGLILGYFFFLVMGFGVVGVLSAFLRSHTISLLENIKKLNEGTSQKMKTFSNICKAKLLAGFSISRLILTPPL